MRYKYRKRTAKKTAVAPNGSPTPTVRTENDRDSIDELISFFDACVLSRDKEVVLEKLKSSVNVRMQSNENNREIFDKCFHLYRVDMDLVNFQSN